MTSWCIFLVALVAAGGTFYIREQLVHSQPGIEVDMQISRGTFVELFLNDLDPYRQPAAAGERHVYRFEKLPYNITRLRLDPTEQSDAQIAIYSVTVKSGERVVRQFGPATLNNWTHTNLSAAREEAGGLVLTSTTDDPILSAVVALRLPGGNGGDAVPVR